MSGPHRTIVAWQKAIALVTEIYRVTEDFPKTEMYGLTSQLRRAAVSVPSNIAEGRGRRSKREYVQFLYRARGSLLEVETQLEIAHNLAFLPDDRFTGLCNEVDDAGRVLNGLIANVQGQVNDDESL
jgi:four helix bundle protein